MSTSTSRPGNSIVIGNIVPSGCSTDSPAATLLCSSRPHGLSYASHRLTGALEVGDDNGVRNLEAQVRTKKTAVDAAKQARDAAKQERESKYEELQKLLKFRTMADAVGRGMQLEKERDAIAVALQFVYLDADGSGEISWSEYEAWARQEWSKLRPALPHDCPAVMIDLMQVRTAAAASPQHEQLTSAFRTHGRTTRRSGRRSARCTNGSALPEMRW